MPSIKPNTPLPSRTKRDRIERLRRRIANAKALGSFNADVVAILAGILDLLADEL